MIWEYMMTFGPGDDFTTGCLLDYPYLKEH